MNEADDPYTALREAYLERRRLEIEALHGRFPPANPAPVAPSVTPAEDFVTSAPPVTIVTEPAEFGSDGNGVSEPAVSPAASAPTPFQPEL